TSAVDLAPEARLTSAYLIVALVALFGGILTGFLQALEHAKLDLYPFVAPVIKGYYHGLTIHGVLNVLVFTTFFIMGFLTFITTRGLERPLASRRLGWVTFWLMVGGLVTAAIPLMANAATVMFTFYPPLKAHWAFYVGLTIVVVGTWLVMINLVLTQQAWSAPPPLDRTPLAASMSLLTLLLSTIAS